MVLQGFDRGQVATLTLDIDAAGRLAQRCANVLAFNPNGLPASVSSLLEDTFGVDGSDAAELADIRRRFAICGPRLRTVTYLRTTRQSAIAGNMGHVAFVEFNAFIPITNSIHITPPYFPPRDATDRVITLLHESIHLLNAAPGHPGGLFPVIPGHQRNAPPVRSRLGLSFADALLNPYCFEHFARFLP